MADKNVNQMGIISFTKDGKPMIIRIGNPTPERKKSVWKKIGNLFTKTSALVRLVSIRTEDKNSPL